MVTENRALIMRTDLRKRENIKITTIAEVENDDFCKHQKNHNSYCQEMFALRSQCCLTIPIVSVRTLSAMICLVFCIR